MGGAHRQGTLVEERCQTGGADDVAPGPSQLVQLGLVGGALHAQRDPTHKPTLLLEAQKRGMGSIQTVKPYCVLEENMHIDVHTLHRQLHYYGSTHLKN